MKTLRTIALSTFVGLVALTAATIGAPVAAEAAANTGPYNTSVYLPAGTSTTANSLTAEEAEGLRFMVEEEKLARDVYLTLYDEWDFRIFQNIAKAEQTHMDAIRTLLDRYDIVDPTIGNDIGEFTNTELQALYDKLVAAGSESLADALLVGGAIEEIDILDLEERIEGTGNSDIIQVYERLLSGSENHLRAYVSTYERQTGEVYAPQYMSQDVYDAILSGSNGHNQGDGNNGGQGQGNGSGQGNGGRQGSSSGHGRGNSGGQSQRGSQGHGSGDGSCLTN